MHDINTMTNRQLVAGLMRGSLKDFQQGYGPESAVLTVEDMRERDDRLMGEVDRNELLAYAQGFYDGLDEDSSNVMLSGARHSDATVSA
jgi:hypothetical protein